MITQLTVSRLANCSSGLNVNVTKTVLGSIIWISPLVDIGFNSSMGDVKVSSTQPIYTVLCKDQMPVCVTVENPKEEFLINHFYFKCLLLDQKQECETCKWSFIYNLQFAFNPATFERDLSRIYNWQFNIYQTELKSQAAVLMRHSPHRNCEEQ